VLERYVTGRYSSDKKSQISTHYATLTDFPAIRKIVRDAQPDYVIHLAAISPVSFSYDHYIEVTEANYLGTVNLAEACYREVPHFRQFIMAGTSEEYGMTLKNAKSKLTEESELSPNSPYAVAKVAADLYLRYMYQAYKFPFTVLRPYNTFGRKDNKHFFIERTITQMLNGDTVYLGDKSAVRDWIYVDDHVDGYVKALGNKKAIGEIIQLCSGKGYTTGETARIIAKLTGFEGEIVWNATQKRPLDAKVLIGDNSKAKKLLNWAPRYTLEEGLRKTVALWKKKN
jgi:nucleoside-diphosphate-sugar epimerase